MVFWLLVLNLLSPKITENAFTSENKTAVNINPENYSPSENTLILHRKCSIFEDLYIWFYNHIKQTGKKTTGKSNYRFLLCGRGRFSSSLGGLEMTKKKSIKTIIHGSELRKERENVGNRRNEIQTEKNRWLEDYCLKLMNDFSDLLREKEIRIPFLGQKLFWRTAQQKNPRNLLRKRGFIRAVRDYI